MQMLLFCDDRRFVCLLIDDDGSWTFRFSFARLLVCRLSFVVRRSSFHLSFVTSHLSRRRVGSFVVGGIHDYIPLTLVPIRYRGKIAFVSPKKRK
jgi:hypothetical protein